MQAQGVTGRKRGQQPLYPTPRKWSVHGFFSASAASLPTVKMPKKRGRKPGHKLKSRVLMPPLALSPLRSTPEPDLSSIPQDTAPVPRLAAPRELTVCLYINKHANAGPYLEREKVQQLPEHLGPEQPATVLQQAVQACIDCAHQQKRVFALVKQGHSGELVSVSASFDGKQHLRSLPVVNSVGYVLRFLAKLCRSLLCDDLFSHQPFHGTSSTSKKAPEREAAKTVTMEECLASPTDMSCYSMDSCSTTFHHRGSLPPSSLYCKKLNSGDCHLGGGPAATTSVLHVGPVSSGGSSAPGLRPPGSSPKRNGISLEGNRCSNVTDALAFL